MADRLSIIAVTSELPWPLTSGGHLRSYHLLRSLATRHDLRLIVPVGPNRENDIATIRGHGINVCAVQVSGSVAWSTSLRALAAAARGRPFVMYSRHERAAVRQRIITESERSKPDLWYLDHLDSFVYADEVRTGLLVGDMHNVYSLLVARSADEQRNPATRLYLKREATLLARKEQQAATSADVIVTVSDQESLAFSSMGAHRTLVVTNGVDFPRYASLKIADRQGPPTVLYLGAMSWEPNAEAAIFLARKVMPRLQKHVPDVRLQIVGRDPLPQVRQLATLSGVDVLGAVPDIIPHLECAHALAVPLESGGGTRIKIIEAFAAGVPVVSTPVGCEGIRGRHHQELLIASREHFADALNALLTSPVLARRLAQAAREVARSDYDWEAIGAKLSQDLEEQARHHSNSYRSV